MIKTKKMKTLQIAHFPLLIFLSSSFLFDWTVAFTLNNITCSGSTLLDFRVEGCSFPPCSIKKGEKLAFEIDLSFERPRELADDVYFNVFLPKYAAPPAHHGSTLVTATCDKGNLGFNCPIIAGIPYTLKSSLVIDAKAECTANCEQMGANGTGLRETKWRWTISDSKGKSGRKGRQYSTCHFNLPLNIVE